MKAINNLSKAQQDAVPYPPFSFDLPMGELLAAYQEQAHDVKKRLLADSDFQSLFGKHVLMELEMELERMK